MPLDEIHPGFGVADGSVEGAGTEEIDGIEQRRERDRVQIFLSVDHLGQERAGEHQVAAGVGGMGADVGAAEGVGGGKLVVQTQVVDCGAERGLGAVHIALLDYSHRKQWSTDAEEKRGDDEQVSHCRNADS